MTKDSLICATPWCSNPVAKVGGYCKACIPARINYNLPDNHLALAYWREKARDD